MKLSMFTADMLTALESAKDTLLSTGKSILDIVAAIGILICTGVFLFNLFAFLRVNREGGTHGNEGRNMVITIAVAILCGAWSIWGGLMLGTGDAGNSDGVTAMIQMMPFWW